MHRAGAALRDAAAEFRARQSDFVTDHPEERRLVLNIEVVFNPIDLELDRHPASCCLEDL
jgi:hypothetical protein